MESTSKAQDLLSRGDYEALVAELRRQNLYDDGGIPVSMGDKVWVQVTTNRWLCGIVGAITSNYMILEQASWIDHTGEYWGESIIKGADANGWSSEYQGRTILSTRDGVDEVLFMGAEARLPTESIRPKDQS